MKFATSAILTIVIALAAGSPAFARQADAEPATLKAKVDVNHDTTVAGQKIERGSYVAQLVDGAEPVLVLIRNKKEVARLRVDRKDLGFQPQHDQLIYSTTGGAREITAIAFKNQSSAFVVAGVATVANAVEP